MGYPIAENADELQSIINGSDSCPSIAADEVARIVDLAERRADLRNEDSAFEASDYDCVISTDWTGFAAGEFDYDNGHVNEFAMGVLQEEASAEKEATLFKQAIVVQNGWLQTGDGRRNKVVEYHDEDFDKASPGEMWIPKNAQDYILIVKLDPAMVHGEPDIADAM